MTLYQGLLFAHVVAAIVWVGGATMLQFVALRAWARGPEGIAAYGQDMEFIGRNVLTPAALAVLVCGLGMVIDVWGFGQDWVLIALVLYAIAFGTAMTYFGAESARVKQVLVTDGFDAAKRRAARLTFATRVELALLYLIVFDMFFKPTFSSYGLLAWPAAAFLVWTAWFAARATTPSFAARPEPIAV